MSKRGLFTLLAVGLAVALFDSWAYAKKKVDPVKAATQGDVGNFLDLRNETFICSDVGCAMPVRGILIGCDIKGCRPVTDIIVSSGAVKRVSPQIPK